MSRWFRFYDDVLNDPKILKLPDFLFRIWVCILCVASKNGGKIPGEDDLALLLRIKREKISTSLKELIKHGLIDNGELLSPHNWEKRQFKSDVSNERVQRYRERKRNVTPSHQTTEQNRKSAGAREANGKGPLAPAPPEELSAGEWELVIKSYKDFGIWSRHAGPEPPSPACQCPKELLVKHGLTTQ